MNTQETLKKHLAEHIGVEVDDIKNDDLLIHDLHMSATDISDFLEFLENEGFNTSKIDLSETETVEELLEQVAENSTE